MPRVGSVYGRATIPTRALGPTSPNPPASRKSRSGQRNCPCACNRRTSTPSASSSQRRPRPLPAGAAAGRPTPTCCRRQSAQHAGAGPLALRAPAPHCDKQEHTNGESTRAEKAGERQSATSHLPTRLSRQPLARSFRSPPTADKNLEHARTTRAQAVCHRIDTVYPSDLPKQCASVDREGD